MSWNFALEWTKRSGLKPFTASPWHFAQSGPTWPRCGSLWQVAHANGTPLYWRDPAGGPIPLTRPTTDVASGRWHFSHATAAWAPWKNSGWRGCWKAVSLKDVVPWQVWQVVPSFPLWTSAWHDAHAAFAPRKSTIRCETGMLTRAWTPADL